MSKNISSLFSVLLIVSLIFPTSAFNKARSFSSLTQFNQTLSGRVTDQNGNGIPGVTIVAVLDNLVTYLPFIGKSGSSSGPIKPPTDSGQNYYVVETDVDGYYSLDSLPPGRYVIAARKAGIDFEPLSYSINTSTESSNYDFQSVDIPTVYKAGTITLSQDTLDQLISISDDGKTFVFAAEASELADLQPGNVIIGGISSLTPEGFLRTVISVSSSETQRVITTEYATLQDAFESLSINFKQTLTPDHLESIENIPGITILREPAIMEKLGEFELSLENVILYDDDGNLSTIEDQIIANGNISFSPEVDCRILISGIHLEEFYLLSSMMVETNLTIQAKINKTISKEKSLIPTIRLTPLTIGAVVITPTIDLIAGIDGSILAGVTSSISNTTYFAAGLWHINNQTRNLNDFYTNFSYIPPVFTANLSFKAYIGPKISIKIYDTIGGYVKPALAALLTIDTASNPWLTLHGGLEVTVGANVTIPILGIVLLDKEFGAINYWRLLYSLSTANNRPPNPPSNPLPPHEATNQSLLLQLSWTCNDPDGDALVYDVFFDEGTVVPTTKVVDHHSASSYTTGQLRAGTTYSWKVRVFDQYGAFTDGPVWRFTTAIISENRSEQRIAAGTAHTCAITQNGGVKCWGWNRDGQLGDGTTIQRAQPVDVIGLSNGVEAIVAEEFHTCALLQSGGVKCWGWNGYGQLGDGTTINRLTPVDVIGLSSGVRAISAGARHTCVLTQAGGVKCWGLNEDGQLGDGTTTNRLTPIDVVGLSSGVRAINADHRHTCAVLNSGRVKCWGWNGYGQLGDGTTINRLTPVDVIGLSSGVNVIDAGDYHTCALLQTGGVRCWGWNYKGGLGDGTTTSRLTPVDVVGLSSGVQLLAAGHLHTCVLLQSNGVKCWGDNLHGSLGDGTTIDRLIPIDVVGLSFGVHTINAGYRHNCALLQSGGIMCWGHNGNGQLGDGTTIDRLTPIDVIGFP